MLLIFEAVTSVQCTVRVHVVQFTVHMVTIRFYVYSAVLLVASMYCSSFFFIFVSFWMSCSILPDSFVSIMLTVVPTQNIGILSKDFKGQAHEKLIDG